MRDLYTVVRVAVEDDSARLRVLERRDVGDLRRVTNRVDRDRDRVGIDQANEVADFLSGQRPIEDANVVELALVVLPGA